MALCVKNQIDKVLIDKMVEFHVSNIPDFMDWGSSMNDVVEGLVADTALKDDRLQKSKLRQLWRDAEGIVMKSRKRKADDLPIEDLDDPIDEQVYKTIAQTYKQYYNFKDLDPKRIGDDKLHGRVNRQFQARTPSMWPILNCHSLAACTERAAFKVPRKKERLGRLSIEVNAPEPIVPKKATLSNYFACFEILTQTWATCGCFDVSIKITQPGQADSTKQVKYAHWSDCDAYRFLFMHEASVLREKYPEWKVLNFLMTIEEGVRGYACQMARQDVDPVPWGTALLAAYKNNPELWNLHRHLLDGDASAPSHQLAPPQQSHGEGQARPFRAVHCRAFQTAQGCYKQNCEYLHACNAVKSNGGFCNLKNHGAANHNWSKGGQGSHTRNGRSLGNFAKKTQKGGRGKGTWK